MSHDLICGTSGCSFEIVSPNLWLAFIGGNVLGSAYFNNRIFSEENVDAGYRPSWSQT